jgi:uncharacterized linocin/CFP29 family protein
MPEFILNGQAHGSVANRLLQSGFDPNTFRPYIDEHGVHCVTINAAGGAPVAVPLTNATATLRKDEWKLLDEAVVKAAKPRLRVVADIRGAGLEFTVPNGLGTTILETETVSDISAATISMDGLRKDSADRPVYELTGLPLPIISKDFHFSARNLATSRRLGAPLDTTTAELAARRVAEEAEKLTLGVSSSFAYGGGTVYGLMNLSGRMEASLTDPTSSGWTGATLLAEVLAMKAQSQAQYHYGPWNLYFSPDWDQYLDSDFSTAKGDITLRERLAKIEGIQKVATVDYQTAETAILVQMTSDVIREVVGMEIQTLQWETEGGMMLNFKVMCIIVPQLRVDQNGNGGVVHGTIS